MAQVNWENFDKLHVVRALRRLIGNWFQVQINFADQKGYLRGVPKGKFFNPLHQACIALVATEKGFQCARQSIVDQTASVMANHQVQFGEDFAGFSTITVPIVIDKVFLGTVLADGFITEEKANAQKQKIRFQLMHHKVGSEEEIAQMLEDIPILGQKDIAYLTELLQLVVFEMVSVNKELIETHEALKVLEDRLQTKEGMFGIVGKSKPMQKIYQLLEKVKDSKALVLIQGENGTGKELIAQALHYSSLRKQKPFLVVNCGAFNENLLESELFGHVKGAFSGAIANKEGLFAAAKDGTLFLDEIGETSLAMQVKLLRVLQDGSFTPVGAIKEQKSQARIVCATNRDLSKMIAEGAFREDLFYRLNVIQLELPALRNRPEDLPLLIDFFVNEYAQKNELPSVQIAESAMALLLGHSWPGNIRELKNEVERMCLLSQGDITDEDLSDRIKQSPPLRKVLNAESAHLKDIIAEVESEVIAAGLLRTQYNKTQLAKDLGISRASLIGKVSKYGLNKKD